MLYFYKTSKSEGMNIMQRISKLEPIHLNLTEVKSDEDMMAQLGEMTLTFEISENEEKPLYECLRHIAWGKKKAIA